MDRISILQKLLSAYQQLLALVKPKAPVVSASPTLIQPLTNAQRLVAAAKAALGTSLWIGTGVDYRYACAISVNELHQKEFGFPIGGEASTEQMYLKLLKSPYFKLTTVYAPGCIIISPTGQGKNPKYPNGHVGVVCNFGICANYSPTGLWSEKYKDYDAWVAQFGTIEDYPTYLFQRI